MSRTVKTFMIAAMMLTGSVFAVPVMASDAGFGVRFTNRAPAALKDDAPVATPAVDVAVDQDVSADGLNEITPAAGEVVIPPSYDTVIENDTAIEQAPDDSIKTEALE